MIENRIAGWMTPQDKAAYAKQDQFRKQAAPGIRGIDPNTGRMSGALPYNGPTAFSDERNAGQFAGMNQQPTRFQNMLGFMPKTAPQGAGMGATASQGIPPVKPDATPAPKVQSVSKPATTVSKPPMAQSTPAMTPAPSIYGRKDVGMFEGSEPAPSIYGRNSGVFDWLWRDLSTNYYG